MNFSKEELERYSRHLILPDFNVEGQRKLKESRVLVVGAGGLGSPVLSYLSAAGVGTLGIIDFDTIDITNLQRQVLFTVDDLGKKKVDRAKSRIQDLNPNITINAYDLLLTSENALDILTNYDIVVDGTDNFPTRYLLNDACVILEKTLIYGSIFRFEGQVSVFNHLDESGVRGPNYRDLFPTPPPPGTVPSCAEGGVLGVLPGIIGSYQANEAIKIITGLGESLSGRLFLFDALSLQSRIVTVRKSSNSEEIKELIDYEEFCAQTNLNGNNSKEDTTMKEMTVTELNDLINSGEDYQLIDVRESYEWDIANLGCDHIPLGEILSSNDRISRDKKVIIHCRSGARSAQAIKALERQHGFENLYNLKGGILAWADEIDSSMPKY